MSSSGFTPLAPIAGEVVPPGEADAIGVITQVIETQIRDSAKTGLARRDAHAKADGVVRAEFRVLDDLPPHLRVGVFAEPRTYDAWIRFSNSSGTPQPDGKLDGRGMAIKLMDVGASPSTTQDFILINNPVFMVRNAIDYVDLQTKGLLYFFFPSLNPLRWRLHELMVTIAIFTNKALNPLNLRYWSMTPYRFGGDTACKFSTRPAGEPSLFNAKRHTRLPARQHGRRSSPNRPRPSISRSNGAPIRLHAGRRRHRRLERGRLAFRAARQDHDPDADLHDAGTGQVLREPFLLALALRG